MKKKLVKVGNAQKVRLGATYPCPWCYCSNCSGGGSFYVQGQAYEQAANNAEYT